MFRLESHLERLHRSLQGLGIDLRLESADVRDEISRLLESNRLKDARVRLTVTGGLFDGSFGLVRGNPPNVLITATPIRSPTAGMYAGGTSLWVASFRQQWASPLARLKTIQRLEYMMAREEAEKNGADDALILDDRENIAECSSSNVLLFLGDTLVTPPLESPILAGVTREVALEAARECGYSTHQRQVSVTDLESAAEVFVTSTSAEVLGVRSVNGRAVGAGSVGDRTRGVHLGFRKIVSRETGNF